MQVLGALLGGQAEQVQHHHGADDERAPRERDAEPVAPAVGAAAATNDLAQTIGVQFTGTAGDQSDPFENSLTLAAGWAGGAELENGLENWLRLCCTPAQADSMGAPSNRPSALRRVAPGDRDPGTGDFG